MSSLLIRNLCGSAAVVALAAPGLAAAQTSAPRPTPDVAGASTVDTVTVTGTRIKRDGYEAPTPVTVMSRDDLVKAAPTGISKAILQLPQFTASISENSQFNANPTSIRAGTTLNLRGLGTQRLLNLVDGFRAPPTDSTGSVNIDIIPQAIIQRVDIVTAGASAAYGSDAVSGVVNYILNKNFTGLEVGLQGGVSTYNDNGNYRVSGTWGRSIGERGHVILSAMQYHSDGYLKKDRPDLYNGQLAVGSVAGSSSAPGTAKNPLIEVTGAKTNWLSPYGLILRTGTYPSSDVNTLFLDNGSFRAANLGTPTGTGGVFTGVGDLDYVRDAGTAGSPQSTTQGFGRFSYEVAPDITAYAQATVSRAELHSVVWPLFFWPGGLPIFSDNAYMPAGIHIPALDGSANPAFYVVHAFQDFPEHQEARLQDSNYTARVGFDGRTAGFDWQLAYQRASSVSHISSPHGVNSLRMSAALDAVKDPATGNIVCRVTLTNPGLYPGCVPLNPFGPTVASPQALAYVMGTTSHARQELDFDSVSASVSGDVAKLWAGPLSVAAGAEYRKQSLSITSDSDPSKPLDLTGLRGGVPQNSVHTLGDIGQSNGSYDVKEAFAEISLPLLKDSVIAKSLDLNAAARLTDYSTSGTIATWKIGGTWTPFDGLRFRVTRSRDIRAPSLFELYQGPTNGAASIIDPHTNTVGAVTVVTGGNPNLVPEEADTVAIGFSAAPSFLPNFRFSVDYYHLEIGNAIATTNATTMLTECEKSNGAAPVCQLITRPLPFSDRSPANSLTKILVGPVNIAKLSTKGLDVDASYGADVGRGRLDFRLIGNFVFSQTQQSTTSSPVIEYAGFTEAPSVPKVRVNLQADYRLDNFDVFVQERMIGSLKRGPVQIWAEPKVPAVFYTDLTLTYRLGPESKNQVFFTINNLFNRQAPVVAIFTGNSNGALATILPLYDTTGRMFTAGIRLRF